MPGRRKAAGADRFPCVAGVWRQAGNAGDAYQGDNGRYRGDGGKCGKERLRVAQGMDPPPEQFLGDNPCRQAPAGPVHAASGGRGMFSGGVRPGGPESTGQGKGNN